MIIIIIIMIILFVWFFSPLFLYATGFGMICGIYVFFTQGLACCLVDSCYWVNMVEWMIPYLCVWKHKQNIAVIDFAKLLIFSCFGHSSFPVFRGITSSTQNRLETLKGLCASVLFYL